MDTGKWMTVSQARQALGKSERTIRRWRDNGKLQSRQGDSGVEVLVDATGIKTGTEQALPVATPAELVAEVERLKVELDRRDRQISELQDDKRHLRERAERLEQLLAMEKQQNQQLIDYQLQPFWKRWFSRQKALPGPENVMDVASEPPEQE